MLHFNRLSKPCIVSSVALRQYSKSVVLRSSTSLKVEIKVLSDPRCPWCFVAHQRLERVLDKIHKLRNNVTFHITHAPYFLDDTLPKGWLSFIYIFSTLIYIFILTSIVCGCLGCHVFICVYMFIPPLFFVIIHVCIYIGGICKRTYYEKRFGSKEMEGAVGAIQAAFEKEGIQRMITSDNEPIAYTLDGVACSSLPGKREGMK